MAGTWTIDAPRSGCTLDAAAVGRLMAAAEQAAPARPMFDFLNGLAPVDYVSLVVYDEDAPRQLEGLAAVAGGDGVATECFDIYRRHHFRVDQATGIAAGLRQGAGPGVMALHLRADELPSAQWRHEIYERRRLADRLSFLYAPLPRTAMALNLYRDQSRGAFGAQEIDRLLAVCPLLRQVHRAVLSRPADEGEPIARAEAALARRAPRLSARERAVCARVAAGISADGIAADLDIAPSTVATLRKRAYAKLAGQGVAGGRWALLRWLARDDAATTA